jgi:hypothetical protein
MLLPRAHTAVFSGYAFALLVNNCCSTYAMT